MWTDKLYRRERRGQEPDQSIEARLFRGFAAHGSGLMCCHDLEGVLLWVSPAAAILLGYKPEEAEGSRLDSFLVPKARALFPYYLQRIQRLGFDRGLMRVQAQDGREQVWSYRNSLGDDPDLIPHVFGHALDVTKHVQTESQLRDSFRHMPVGQMEIDSQGRLRRINPVGCQILGYSELELLSGKGFSPTEDLCQEMLLGGETPRRIIFTRRDGRVLHLEIYVRRVANDFDGANCVLLDVSERVQADTKVRNLNSQLQAKIMANTAELRKSNAELREFAHIASHDLQAPLRQVSRNLNKLASNVTGEEAMEYVEKVQGDVQRMSMLVESLLAYALASNENKAPTTLVPLHVAIEESLMNLAGVISSSEAVVLYSGLPEVNVNESDFVQLFQNLIGNALKYRSSESPRVEISAAREGNAWVISVKDNGIGIDPRYSDRIFEAFRRLHGKEYAGTGMGLAICKKIVDRAGGRIWVESEPGQGSTFRFTLRD